MIAPLPALQSVFIPISARRLFATHAGQGQPTIILESGLGGTAADWALVQPALAQLTRVWAYDRAGLGQSDPAPTPRTCQDWVGDLHALLTNVHLAPPYVLVGHSLGGLSVRLYAAQHPTAVVGMVLVDASHEDKHQQFETVLSADLVARNQAYLQDPTRNVEQLDVVASNAQVRAARRTFDFPLIVVARGQPDAPSPIWPTAALQQIEVNLQRELAHHSPQGTFWLAEQSGHFIQRDQPTLVVAAIRQVVEQARLARHSG